MITDNFEGLNDSWELQVDQRTIEYEMVSRVAMIEGNDHDEARRTIMQYCEEVGSKMDLETSLAMLKNILFKEQKGILKRFLQNECNVHISRLEEVIQGITSIDELRLAAESITEVHKGAASVDYGERIKNWEMNVEGLGRRFFYTNDLNRKMINEIRKKLYEHEAVLPHHDRITEILFYDMVRFVFLRVSDVPRLKDVTKPTIVLVGGTSGTGKSTVSQHITRMFNFPIYASTDVISREVVRRVFSWMMGDEEARSTFPELFGSSFEGSDLSWYYIHSMLTMIGVSAVIERLVEVGRSAVIEGVPLVPGFLPDKFFEMANIVWIVTCVDEEDVHLRRYSGRDKPGVSRGGSERYRRSFEIIRNIHDGLSRAAKMGGAFRLNNSGKLKDTLDLAMEHVMGPFADKGLGISDELRDSSVFDLSRRRYHARFDAADRSWDNSFSRSHSRPESGGPSIAQIDEAMHLWSSRARKRIKTMEKELHKIGSPEGSATPGELGSKIEECRRDIQISEEIIQPKIILGLLRNNFEFLRATRALLTQLRSIQVHLVARLTAVPGTNYDESKAVVHRFFNGDGNMKDMDRARSTIRNLMFRELLYNIQCFLENEYNVEVKRSRIEFSDLSNPNDLKSSLEGVLDKIFLTTLDREVSMIQIESMIEIWEGNLDETIEKTFKVFSRWKDLEEGEKELLYGDPVVSGIAEKLSKEELHRLVRWLTPRLYDVPKLKDLERRPTLVLINGDPEIEGSNVLNHITNMLSIPTCFTSDIVEKVVVRTIEWLLGSEVTRTAFPSLYVGPDDDLSLDVFYERAGLTMLGMKGAIDRLIKENTSAVVLGEVLIPGMLEERYYESSNLIGIVTRIGNEGGRYDHINKRSCDLAKRGHVLTVDDPTEPASMEVIRTRVTSPYADRGLPVEDEIRDGGIARLEGMRKRIAIEHDRLSSGALLTDIDDTILPSGTRPGDEWIDTFSSFVRTLARNRVIWAPMSGVAHDRLGERLLFRLPEDACFNTIAYLGDGSSKYLFDDIGRRWVKDPHFDRELTDAQAVALIGSKRYHQYLLDTIPVGNHRALIDERVDKALERIREHNDEVDPSLAPIDPERGIVGELEEQLGGSFLTSRLKEKGYVLKDPETYFRGGSVSWMMLGDISADPYEEEASMEIRINKLIPFAERRLREHHGLFDLGEREVHVPFPGARGIKFVLSGNDKERGARDLIEKYELPAGSILFVGNELFTGGNDDMLRKVQGITLLSVGTRQDQGVIDWGAGVEASGSLMDRIRKELQNGKRFENILDGLDKRT